MLKKMIEATGKDPDAAMQKALAKKADDRDALILFIREYFKRNDLQLGGMEDNLGLGMGVFEDASDDTVVDMAEALTSIMISVSNIQGLLAVGHTMTVSRKATEKEKL